MTFIFTPGGEGPDQVMYGGGAWLKSTVLETFLITRCLLDALYSLDEMTSPTNPILCIRHRSCCCTHADAFQSHMQVKANGTYLHAKRRLVLCLRAC